MTTSTKITITYGPKPDPGAEERELEAGLDESPPRLPTRYFYDDRGSELFERIENVLEQ